MRQSLQQLASIVAAKTSSGKLPHTYLQSLAAYLLDESRVNELDSFLRDLQAAWAEAGVVLVAVRSAHALSPAIRQAVETEVHQVYPRAKQIIIESHIHPELVGGIQLRFTDYLLDLSISGKLQQLKVLAANGKD